MKNPDDYAFLWNSTQPGWVLLRINRQAFSVDICFAMGGPTLREIATMRAVIPSFSALPPSEAFAALKGKSKVH